MNTFQTNSLEEIFFQESVKSFNFLVERSHFHQPIQRPIYAGVEVIFLATNVAVECVLDRRDEYIGCCISKVFNGEVAQPGYKDANGNFVRMELDEFVLTRGADDKHLFTKVGKLSLVACIPITLKDYADMLIKYGKDIMLDSPRIFEKSK